MPSSRSVRKTRIAISPRLATRTLRNGATVTHILPAQGRDGLATRTRRRGRCCRRRRGRPATGGVPCVLGLDELDLRSAPALSRPRRERVELLERREDDGALVLARLRLDYKLHATD